MPAERAPDGVNRAAITVCVILATLMYALDSTIANIALPYIQGSVSATQSQIGWVLTSYLVAGAIMTPATGFLAGRFGLKRVFLVSVVGFTITSMLCGLSQSLVEIVIFRILQGLFGASLVPLSQTVLMNIYPKAQQGSALALWSIAIMVGPVLGPVLGGWLTSAYSWRYVFFINLPIGIGAFLGISVFMTEASGNLDAKLDWLGFGALSVAIGAMQVLLDRGQELDWFGSQEIVIEAILAVSAFYLFLVHTFTAREPFIRPSLFRDRNFTAGALFGVVVGLTYYASLALQPPYLQNLMNYPILSAGLVLGPRGLGTMAAFIVVGRLVGRVDTRLLLAVGIGLTIWAFYEMTGWTPDVSRTAVVMVGVIQGVGLGFLFLPLSVVTLATLTPDSRAEGAGFSTLARNIGSSVGISVVNALLTRNTQVNHAAIAKSVTAVNRVFEEPMITRFWSPTTAAGRAALDAVITRQAQIIAYIDDYKLLMIATLCVAPLILVFKKPSDAGASDHAMVMD
jgi:DHA2 family multidrug resistance protein